MKFTWHTEWPHWVLLVAMFVAAAVTWSQLPDQVPIHWGVRGGVDQFSGKFEGLLVIPIAALAMYFLFLALPRIDPARANYAHFAGAYHLLRFAVLLVTALIYAVILLSIRGGAAGLGMFVPVIVGGFLVVMARVMRRFEPNWFVGIRTPWTLSSRRAWTETHRVASWVFMATGIGLVAAGLARSEPALIATAIVAAAGILGTIVYSYFVWRGDPDRSPPGGSLSAR